MAKVSGITGTSVVQIDLSATGEVVGASISVSSGSKLLDDAAKRTASAMTYAPEIRSCSTVPGFYGVQVEFVD